MMGSMMYERHHAPLAPRNVFLRRVVGHFAAGSSLLVVSLGGGMAGYMHYEHLPWRDAFVNAAMLLGGMGQVSPLTTPAGKVFAGLYALYAGLIFLVAVGLIFAPVVHRLLHRFHVEDEVGQTISPPAPREPAAAAPVPAVHDASGRGRRGRR